MIDTVFMILSCIFGLILLPGMIFVIYLFGKCCWIMFFAVTSNFKQAVK